MASLSKRLSENSSETLQAVVELLHDSPSWPDLEPVLKLLRTQTRFLQDIKFEVHRIESMVDGAQRPFTRDPKENDDPERDGEVGKLGTDARIEPTKEQLLGMDIASNWVDSNQMILDELEGELRDWGVDRLKDMLSLSFSPDKVIPRLRHFILSRKLDKLRDQIKSLPSAQDIRAVTSTIINGLNKFDKKVTDQISNESERLLEEMRSLQLPLVERLDKLSASLLACCDGMGQSFTQVLDSLARLHSLVDTSHASLVQLITTSAQTLGAGITSIITKIEDCCVKQEISESVIPTLNMVNEDTSDIRRIVRSGGSPGSQTSTGAILAAIKSVQSELSEIRRLL